jgi:hypothetical protein
MNEVTREWVAKAEGDFAMASREMGALGNPNFDAVQLSDSPGRDLRGDCGILGGDEPGSQLTDQGSQTTGNWELRTETESPGSRWPGGVTRREKEVERWQVGNFWRRR